MLKKQAFRPNSMTSSLRTNEVKRVNMFKKLRNKFLLLNISIITVIMISAFIVIYLVTYNNIQTANKAKLGSGIAVSSRTNFNNGEAPEPPAEAGTADKSAQVMVHNSSPDDSISFTIEVGNDGEIAAIHSFLEMEDAVYKEAAQLAWKEHKNHSIITVGGKEWMYAFQSIERSNVRTDENGKQTITTSIDDNSQISFLDVTDDSKTLFSLLITFLIVGVVMLFVITFISFYFANRAIRPIRETFEKQKQFIADASHELKTPLTIINANTEVILGNEDETVKNQKKWLHHIKSEAGRMAVLVGDLLYLAKAENIGQDMADDYFDLSNAANEIILTMEAIIFEKGITLSQNIEPGICMTGDTEKIKRVIMILLDNAIKYSDKNGSIDISLKRYKHQIEFKIKNSGTPIAKEYLDKVFDRFYRADESRNSKSGSYGLGLSIAKAIVEKSGGELYAFSNEKEGTSFIFSLKDR